MTTSFICGADGCERTEHKGLGLCDRCYQRYKAGRLSDYEPDRRLALTDQERWEWYVDKSGECWVWNRPAGLQWYGKVSTDGGQELAHRWSYRRHVGPIPDGLEVRHSCDNPPCVRPSHLLLGTHADNMDDMRERKRSGWGSRLACSAGHRYTDESVYVGSHSERVCKICRREGYHRRKQARGELYSTEQVE